MANHQGSVSMGGRGFVYGSDAEKIFNLVLSSLAIFFPTLIRKKKFLSRELDQERRGWNI